MALNFPGTASNFLDNSDNPAPVTARPVTISYWFRWEDLIATWHYTVHIKGNSGYEWSCRLNSSGGNTRMVMGEHMNATIVQVLAASPNPAFAGGEWHHHMITYRTATDREQWLDGVSLGADSTDVTNDMVAGRFTAIGAQTGGANPMDGEMGEVAILKASGNHEMAARLSQRGAIAADLYPALTRAYWPLWGVYDEEPDLVGTWNMTITGTVIGKAHIPGFPFHKPISYYLPQYWDGGAAAGAEIIILTTPLFNWSVQAININAAVALPLTAPTFNWSAQTININAAQFIELTAAVFNWAAQAITLKQNQLIQLTAAAFNWTANALNIKANEVIALTAATFNWSAQAITILTGVFIELTAASFNWAAQSLNIKADAIISLTLASYNWTAQALNIKADRVVVLTAAAFNWAAQTFTLISTFIIVLTTAAFNFMARVLTIVASGLGPSVSSWYLRKARRRRS